MFAFLKSEKFNVIFSLILGIGLVALLQPRCKDGAECRILKAPPFEEVRDSTYQLGSKCYKFSAETIDCPSRGVIEPFERFVR